MNEVFLKIINMSISASWLVLAVLLLRLVLKKAPKWVSVLLWGFVAVRLICPFSIESVLSLIPSAQTVSPEIMMDWTPEVSTGIGSLDTVVNPIISEAFAPKPYASANPLQILIPVAAIGWLVGIAAMLLYTAVSYLLLRRKVTTAVLLRNNIYQSENVDSPFVLGIIRPKIYLSFQMDGQKLEHVIAHEESHIRRKDHWWKPFGFILLALHWFNPLMWLGYILLCRDIELACDEKVIRQMDNESKADYVQALVACSVNRRSIAACPLAFGEVGVKERVKSVMNYKKPAFWIVIAAIVLCIVVAVCFLTNPETDADEQANALLDDFIMINNDTGELVYGGKDGIKVINTISSGLKEYYALSDGTWLADGHRYLYRLEISGRMNNAAAGSTFVYLSNLETITFDQAWKAAGLSSNTADYFSPEEAVLVEHKIDNAANGTIRNDRMTIIAADSIEKAISIAILEKNAGDRFPNAHTVLIPVESHYVLGIESKSGTPVAGQTNHMEEITVYVQYVYHRHTYSAGKPQRVAGTGTPAKITFLRNGEGRYTLKEFWEPNGGDTYAEEIRSKFPQSIADIILDPQNDIIDIEALEEKCLAKAQGYAWNLIH